MKQQKQKDKFNAYARYSNMAFQMIAIILLGTFGGFKLDELLDWGFPVFTVVLSLLSVILAIYISVKDLLK
ncbi:MULTISPECIES: AtpZ/AtpI family protein [unclassified Lentimicrobium]|uniref:AtpZ/AtpI family protein n=1 Tax=unclassified Lentimicrobium TaxID=2677434 RepID=UPI001C12FBD0|nr:MULTISPECIES: AtpZ/AtpI family protein [unclassified Lentimicrobium]